MKVIGLFKRAALDLSEQSGGQVTGNPAGQRQGPDEFEVVFNRGADGRVLDFYGHLFPALSDTAVHLTERRGGERLRVELAKQLLRIFAQRRLELRARQARVHSRGAHLKSSQFLERLRT